MRSIDLRPPLLLLSLTLAGSGCRTLAPAPEPPVDPALSELAAGRDPRLGALLWMQTAAEYRILARAIYAEATAALDRALADPGWSAATEQQGDFAALPPAVIVDVDETVLDNSPYQAALVLAGAHHEKKAWRPWVERAAAPPIPGALEFARAAKARGVTIFYVTNRDAEEEAATRRNLAAAGFPLNDAVDAVLTRGERPGFGSDKTSRRAEVAASFRVLLLVGDDLNDFIDGARPTPEERLAAADAHAERWGVSWFLLPNPEYGGWERALYGNERGLSEAEMMKRRLARLRPPE